MPRITNTSASPVVVDINAATIASMETLGGGQVADDVAAAGNPVVIGGSAVATDGTDPTSVSTEADAARLRTDLQRILLVNPTPPFLFRDATDFAGAQTAIELVAAPGAGLSLYITDIIISNGATAGTVKLVENTGTPVDILENLYLPINGGAVITLRTPLRLTANVNLGITSVTVTTHSITVCGYTAP